MSNYNNKNQSEYLNSNYTDGYSQLSEEERAEMIRRSRERQRRAEQRRRDRMEAYAVMIIFGLIVLGAIVHFVSSGNDKSSDTGISSAVTSESETVSTAEKKKTSSAVKSETAKKKSDKEESSQSESEEGHDIEKIDGITYVDGIMIVNKTYSIPDSYAPGLDSELSEAFERMAADAYEEGIVLFICSGYRSYSEQETLYSSYAAERGVEAADEVSSRAGHSEHQTGLCVDVNSTDFSFGETAEAEWLAENCADYGFIIRFPEGKEDITGYTYEPWHIRYVGEEIAKEITQQGVCLEEYLGVTSDYDDCEDEQ